MPDDPGRVIEARLAQQRMSFHHDRAIGRGGDARGWQREDVEALVEIADLAASGHWGARLFVFDLLESSTAQNAVVRHRRDRVGSMLQFSADLALVAAYLECGASEPRWDEVEGWLAKTPHAPMGLALNEARSRVGAFTKEDLECVKDTLAENRTAGDLLHAMSAWRYESGDASQRGTAQGLLEAACERGSLKALNRVLDHFWPGAPDKAQFLESWCTRYRAHPCADEALEVLALAKPLNDREVLRIHSALKQPGNSGEMLHEVALLRAKQDGGAAACDRLLEQAWRHGRIAALEDLFKRGEASAPDSRAFLEGWFEKFPPLPIAIGSCFLLGVSIDRAGDPEAAAVWYSRSSQGLASLSKSITPSLCYFVATRLDPRVSFAKAQEPELALAWYERGVALGEERCLDDWLRACAKGELGLASDPELAKDRVRRFLAAAGENVAGLHGYQGGLAWTVMRADAYFEGKDVPKDKAIARKWLEVGALMQHPASLRKLTELGG